EGDSGEWTPDGAGDRAHDWVSDDGGAFILAHWWEGSAVEGGAADGGAPAPGDAFRFTVDPGVPWMRIPVLYRQPYEGQGVPLTSNHVNALVDDATILTAQAHGPVVDLGAGPEDVLGGYVARQLRRAGYERIVWLDDRAAYHNLSGSVHCATNAFREIPGASDPSAP
ncbi:MAG: hypothetical protein FJZ90_05155, partial [Chloroflexi bacterium]|nr:hypothetical protein [Chloroflexota bacterium]